MGTLYIVSTPIGNLEDVTFRAARLLGSVDLVLAEDTRRAGILLRHLDIQTALLSLHEHNEESRIEGVLDRLQAGQSLALISDAGTPLVSDPGYRLVGRAVDAGHSVVPIPGPSAVMAALVASNLPLIPFTFLGFPPRKGKERRAVLERVAAGEGTSVLFEAPDRTARTLDELARTAGDTRPAAVARELTKMHEEVRRGTLGELARYYREEPPRGEVTVVVGPRQEMELSGAVDEAAVEALASALLEEGASPSRAAREVARRLGVSRNRVYTLVQQIAHDPGSDAADPAASPST